MIYSLVIAAALAQQPSACAKLSADYENASKALALLFAEGAADNSAIRATMREAREANLRNEARDNLDLMKAHNCALPLSAPSARPYLIQAMDCQTARMQQNSSRDVTKPESTRDIAGPLRRLIPKPALATDGTLVACDTSKWQREQE